MEREESAMARFLIHIHTGPDNPTKAALGFLVAATALKEGHQVDLFIAGDGTLLLGKEAARRLRQVHCHLEIRSKLHEVELTALLAAG